MAPHSSTVAQKIPWMEGPGRLQSMGSLRVRHNWATSLSLSTFTHWRRKWQPTPVFLPGESHGRRSLVGCSPWGHRESDTTEVTSSSNNSVGLDGSGGKSICLQCGRPRFDPWVGKIPWRRKWQPTPVLLPGESHGWKSLVGYNPWGCKESDTAEWLNFHFHFPRWC